MRGIFILSAYGRGMGELVLLLFVVFSSMTIIEIILFILYIIKQTKTRLIALIIFSLLYIPILGFISYLFIINGGAIFPIIFLLLGFFIITLIIAKKKQIRDEE